MIYGIFTFERKELIRIKYKNLLFATSILASTLVFAGCANDDVEKEDKSNKVEEVSKETNQDKKTEITETAVKIDDTAKTENTVKPAEAVTTSKEKTANASENAQKAEGKTTKPDEKIAESGINTTKTTDVKKAEEIKKVDVVFKSKEDKHYNAEFHNGWKISPSKLLQGTIDGRGETASEEGVGVFVIKNNETNSSTIFELANNETAQLTPKAFEWIDDNRVYVIIGFSYGTISKGGNLYEFNIKNKTLTLVSKDLNDTEEIISIKKQKDGNFIYEKQIYDKEFMNSTIKEGKITLHSTK